MTVKELIEKLEMHDQTATVGIEYFVAGKKHSVSEPIDTVFVQPSYKPNAGMLILSNWLDPIPSR